MRAHAAPTAPAPVDWLDAHPPLAPVGVSWGVPWPRGALPKESPLTVQTSGSSVPTQAWPLAFWPDGSVKWSGLAIAADPKLAGPFTVSPGAPAAPASPVTVHDEKKFVDVSTGGLRCRIAKSGANFIKSLSIDGREVGRDGHLIAVREDRSGLESKGVLREDEYISRITAVTVEQSGPVRAVVRIQGVHAGTRDSREWLPFSLRLYFTAGVSSVRMVHSFVFDGDEKKDFIRGLGLAFSVPFREELQNRHVRFATDGDGFWFEPVLMAPGYRSQLVKDAVAMNTTQLEGKRIPNLGQLDDKTAAQIRTVAVWDGFRLDQNTPDSFSIDKRTGPASSWLHAMNGNRAGGLVFLGDVSGGLAVGVRHFWQKYPAAFEIDKASSAAGELKIWLWSPDAPAMDLRRYDTIGHDGKISYEDFQEGFGTPYGVANTAEITLWAMPATPANTELLALEKTTADPPLLVCKPEYYHSVPVFGVWSLPDSSTPDKAAMEDELGRAWKFYKGEVDRRRWYGFWDYGDFMRTYSSMRHGWLYDIGGHAWNNTELMADAWLWYNFLRSGGADAFHLAEAMTRNTSEVDVYHIGRFAGIGSRHNVNHWGCGAKELRISEAFLKRFFYYLTTDERTGDLMRETLTADLNLPHALPLRKAVPRPDVPVLVRTGPDWMAMASNWMTEWERTGNTKYRDYVLAGMRSIGSMPTGFATRMAFGLDLKTKKLSDVADPNLPTGEFVVLFGGDQIANEMMQLFDCPEFTHSWNRLMDTWARMAKGGPGITGARVTAYAARVAHDPALGHKAWDNIRLNAKKHTYDNFPEKPAFLEGSDVAEPVEEIKSVNTPGTSQWALNIITTMELARDFYVEPKPAAAVTPAPSASSSPSSSPSLAPASPTPAAAEEKPVKSALETNPAGWTDILPPADLKGWVRVPMKAGAKIGREQWHVEDGQLVCDGDGGHDMLLLDREVGDAIFHVEFCFTKIDKPKGYNSGVFVRTTQDGAIWHQAQVGSNSGGYFFGVTPDGSGTKKFKVGDGSSRVTAAGEWNTFEVTARGSKLTLWVNGFVTAELPDCGQAKGYLGLEGEGYHIQFRNLKLKELHAAAKTPRPRPRTADGKWFINDMARPWPPRVEPKPETDLAESSKAPAGAIILFDGKDLSKWQPSPWKVGDGCVESVPKTGNLTTREAFGSCKFHCEWQTPDPPQGKGQEPGNSGVYLMSHYEVQILDNTNNKTYADGIAGAIYGQSPPLAEASRPSGHWQTYDITFQRPIFGADGKVSRPGEVTVYFNGILVQDHFKLLGNTGGAAPVYTAHPDKMLFYLQGHSSVVRFRNVWIEPIPDAP